MEAALSTPLTPTFVPVRAELSENSRLGSASPNPALYRGFFAAKSTTALGLQSGLFQTCIGSRSTGKERDAESGNDYFGARYYASTMGRFLSPDWAAKAEPVPYAKLDNPQTLNLYAYMRNNPLGGVDPDGHCDWCQKFSNWVRGDGFVTNMNLKEHITTTETINLGAAKPQSDPWEGHYLAAGVFQGPGSGSFVGANKAVNYGAAAYAAAATAAFFAPEIAAGAGSAASATANATGMLGPAAGRVFWSAIGSGSAAEWAEENGGSTLEMSPLGSFANWAQGFLPQNGVTGAAWNALSSGFASGAQGPVTYLQGAYLGNTWLNTELPILEQNGNPITTVPIP